MILCLSQFRVENEVVEPDFVSVISSQEVEFVSQISGLTDQHGRWELSEGDNKLYIHFNCREGQPVEHGGCILAGLYLHPTRLVRMQYDDTQAPPHASWEGTDDKGYVIHLVHFRS